MPFKMRERANGRNYFRPGGYGQKSLPEQVHRSRYIDQQKNGE